MADPVTTGWTDALPATYGDVARNERGEVIVTMRAMWQGSVFWHRRINLGTSASKLMVREIMTSLHGEALSALAGMS